MSIEASSGVGDDALRLVTAIIHRHLEGRVVRALHELPEFPGFTLTEARGQGRGRGAGGTYVASEYDLTYQRHLQMQIVCDAAAVETVIATLTRAGWTGRRGDGVVFVTPVERFSRIREAGEAQAQAQARDQEEAR